MPLRASAENWRGRAVLEAMGAASRLPSQRDRDPHPRQGMRPYPATSRRGALGVAPRGIGGRSIRSSMPRERDRYRRRRPRSGSVSGAKASRIEPGRPQAGSPGYLISSPHITILNRWDRTDSKNSLDRVDPRRNHCVMPTEDATHLHRIDPARNMARFYRLTSTASLFGDVCVVREWGRIGRPGRMRIDIYEKVEEATAARLVLERSKRHRGYCDVGGPG